MGTAIFKISPLTQDATGSTPFARFFQQTLNYRCFQPIALQVS